MHCQFCFEIKMQGQLYQVLFRNSNAILADLGTDVIVSEMDIIALDFLNVVPPTKLYLFTSNAMSVSEKAPRMMIKRSEIFRAQCHFQLLFLLCCKPSNSFNIPIYLVHKLCNMKHLVGTFTKVEVS